MRVAILLLGVWLTATAVGPASANERGYATHGHPALEAIDAAYQAGRITEAEAILYRFYFVKSWDKLPAEFQIPGEPLKCGTTILTEVYDRMHQLPAEMVREITLERSRPGHLTNTRTTTHYIIHYILSGSDAVPNEAYVDVIEQACEDTWTTLHSTMTWQPPDGDGAAGGGWNKIDCYIHDVGTGILGYAEPENPVPGDPPYDYTGYFHIGNNIGSTYSRACTVAHEDMHVVEFGYIASSAVSWYMENCAMLAEEFVYDSYNDYYGYLQNCLGFPYKSIKTHNEMYEYGAIVWPMYMWQRFDDINMPEAIWDEIQWTNYTGIWDALNNALGTYGYNLDSAVPEYKRWCFYTRDRDDGQHYEEAGHWSAFMFGDRTFSSYPTGEQHPRSSPDMRPEPMGTSLMEFRPAAGGDEVLQVTLDGVDLYTGACEFIRKQSGVNLWFEYSMTIQQPAGTGTIDIPNFDQSQYVFMFTSIKYAPGGPRDYAFWADDVPGTGAIADNPLASGERIRIWPFYPNPMGDNAKINYSLASSGNVEVFIVDANGRAIKSLFADRLNAGSYELMWNGTDNGDARVSSGVYYAVVRFNGEEMTRQVTVLR